MGVHDGVAGGATDEGLLIERSMARLAGTVVGALAGGTLLYFAPSVPVALAALLFWIALCAGLGSLFRHFRNYGLVLAGYTAAIVVLFAIGDTGLNPDLSFDRVWCTVIGIGCSALASIRIAPGHNATDLDRRLNELVQLCLDRVEAHLRHIGTPATGSMLMAGIAALDRMVDEAAAGSLRGRRAALRIRQFSGLLLELVALTPETSDMEASGITVPSGPSVEYFSARDRLFRLIELTDRARQNALDDALAELAWALEDPGGRAFDEVLRAADSRSVLRAAGKSVIALSLAAAIWLASGWQYGFVMAMTATLFASLFSSHDQGSQALVQVLYGSLVGAIVGIAARLFLLPHAGGIIGILLCIAPMLLGGAWMMRCASTAKMAIDLNMTFLLTSQPGATPTDTLTALNQAAAIIAGVLIAAATYWLILPANPRARRRHLAERIVRLTSGSTEAGDLQAAVDRHQALRVTLVRLLDLADPSEPLFAAARSCLIQSRYALTDAVNDPASFRPTPFPATRGDAGRRQAVATLSVAIQEDNR